MSAVLVKDANFRSLLVSIRYFGFQFVFAFDTLKFKTYLIDFVSQTGDLAENWTEEEIVMLYTVVEVDVDVAHSARDFKEALLVLFEFFELLLYDSNILNCRGLFSFRFTSTVSYPLALLRVVCKFFAKISQAFENLTDRFGAIAVHVDKRVECSLGTTEEPVDRPLLVHLEVIIVEILQKVIAD
jgi:hypothetical protein